MKRIVTLFSIAALALLARPSLAQPAAVVEGVQMPAWVEREGRRSPLAVGMELKGGDAVKTGAGSRALVKLAEGSSVKLGENGSLQIAQVNPQREGVFFAVMRVAEGAFRFTTDLVAKQRRRDVSIQVATVTAGIRGTDLWGKSTPDRQIVCLIEGAIDVGAEGEAPVRMDQSRQFYRREKGQTQPIGLVAPEQLGQWALETDIEKGKGAAVRGGKWKVTVASVATQGEALDAYDRIRQQGFAAEIRPAQADGQRVYHVRIGNLPSKEEAEALAARLRSQHNVSDPKVST